MAKVCGGKRAKAEQSAFTAFNSLVWEAFHHVHILGIGQIAVPVISALAVPHGDIGAQRRRRLQLQLVAQGYQSIVFLLVGVGHHVTAVGAVNGADAAEFLNLRGVVNAEGEVILTAVAHELLEFSLALGHDAVADPYGDKQASKTKKFHLFANF